MRKLAEDKKSSSLAFSEGTMRNLRTNNYMPEMLNEADVSVSCEIVKDFMTKTGLPMLERFNDIKELDREINGENFWTTDWQMPFKFGGDFPVKRIIIAKLANNSPGKRMLGHVWQGKSDALDYRLVGWPLNRIEGCEPDGCEINGLRNDTFQRVECG